MVIAAAWQFWMGLTFVLGVFAAMAGTPVWRLLGHVFGAGPLTAHGPFWPCVVIYLSVALPLIVARALALWRWGLATVLVMGLWAYLIFSIGLATAPRGRYLPPVPWLA